MNLQQLRFLNEIVRQGLNISDAAGALYTSQPGISKQIKLLEQELGIEIFVRNGKRIVAVTEPGKAVLEIAQRMLHDMDNLKQVGQEFHAQDSGHLTIATTHTQARYALPPVVKQFIKRYPGVKLGLHQGNPTQIAEQVLSGEADLGIATESLSLY
ncbi:MAG: LysR substrate-binding domain-containing protein, partial [Gallionella sp.]